MYHEPFQQYQIDMYDNVESERLYIRNSQKMLKKYFHLQDTLHSL